jgi:hypothetical protein
MKFAKMWHLVLGITLILWALMLLDILSLSDGDVFLGIGALISGVLLLMNR